MAGKAGSAGTIGIDMNEGGSHLHKHVHKTLNIIGCGKVGKTLGRLWTEHGGFRVQDVLNRSLESGTEAISFVGAGRAVENYAGLRAADVYMIATADDRIADSC